MTTKTEPSELDIEDDVNPLFIFQLTHNDLLCMIAKGVIDAKALAAKELDNRGYDINGNWVGLV